MCYNFFFKSSWESVTLQAHLFGGKDPLNSTKFELARAAGHVSKGMHFLLLRGLVALLEHNAQTAQLSWFWRELLIC